LDARVAYMTGTEKGLLSLEMILHEIRYVQGRGLMATRLQNLLNHNGITDIAGLRRFLANRKVLKILDLGTEMTAAIDRALDDLQRQSRSEMRTEETPDRNLTKKKPLWS